MTQEEKQLLLTDLCGRLPYNYTYLYCNAPFANGEPIILTPVVISNLVNATEDLVIKPYLRPMSSMTEEEYESVSWKGCSHTYNYSLKSGFQFVEIKTFTLNILNWLNANHFDYRGLIEKGLAISTEEFNPYK